EASVSGAGTLNQRSTCHSGSNCGSCAMVSVDLAPQACFGPLFYRRAFAIVQGRTSGFLTNKSSPPPPLILSSRTSDIIRVPTEGRCDPHGRPPDARAGQARRGHRDNGARLIRPATGPIERSPHE